MYKKSSGLNKDQCFFFQRGNNTNNEIIMTSGNCINNWYIKKVSKNEKILFYLVC